MVKKYLILLFVLVGSSLMAQDIPLAQFDKKAIEVVQSFMTAIVNNPKDEDAAIKAALPFIHKSEYNAEGTSLLKDRKDYSFKKAWQNAQFYENPIKVTRVQAQKITAIGFKETAQAGTSYKVFLAKKAGVGGMPAAIHVFIPKDGTEPKVHYYGSL